MAKLFAITGASGHLGVVLCRLLAGRGERVRVLLLPGDPALGLEDLELERFTGNLLDRESLERFLGHDAETELYVLHLAGLISIYDDMTETLWQVNVEGTRHLLEAAKEAGCRRFLYTSSVHAFPELPEGVVQREVDHFDIEGLDGAYAKTKAAASALAKEAAEQGLDVVLVHPSGVIGPDDFLHGSISAVLLSFLKGRMPVSLQGGYDFVDARDVARGMLLALEKGRKGESYLLSGRFVEVDDVFRRLSLLTGIRKPRLKLGQRSLRALAALAESFSKTFRQTPQLTRYAIRTLQANSLFSHEKAAKELGYRIRPFNETLVDTARFLVRYHRLRKLQLHPERLPLTVKPLRKRRGRCKWRFLFRASV